MPDYHGKFVWYELMTTDTKAAESFYRNVVGWSARDAGMPGMDYTLFSADGADVAGLMTVPEEARSMGAGPAWMGYVAVDDVDAAAAQVGNAAGRIFRPPSDIPGIGRFAVVADPQGAVFMLFKPAGGPERPVPAPGTPGHTGWHELHAADGIAAFDFYAALFGWTKGEPMDMGAMGVYQIFAHGDAIIGGMFTKPATEPMPYWLYYFNVAGIDAAVGRVQAGGGKVLNGPMEVPGGSWVIQCLDPQGAMFALVGPKG